MENIRSPSGSPHGSPRRSPSGSPRRGLHRSPSRSPHGRSPRGHRNARADYIPHTSRINIPREDDDAMLLPSRSPSRSPRRGLRRSPSRSPDVRGNNRIKIPREDDNDAMLLWRATVSPIDNIGEPYLAEWTGDFPPNNPSVSLIDNSQPQPQRWMRLYYPRSNGQVVGWWLPGRLVEDIYVLNNFGAEDEFPFGYVAHTPLLASHARLYQRAPPLPHVIPLGILDDEYVEMIADQTYQRGKKYIRNYVNRYIKTIHPFDARFTPAVDKRLREDIVKLLIQTGRQPWGDAPIYACDQWEQRIRPVIDEEGAIGFGDSPDEPRMPRRDVEHNERYNKLGLDLDLFDDDFASEALYNKKGKRAIPGNKADADRIMVRDERNFENAQDMYFPHLKPVEEEMRRKRSQRKRDKKILKAQLKDTSTVYDGGRRRRTRKRKLTKRR